MRIEVLLFGRLVEIAGSSLVVDDVETTGELVQRLQREYPKLINEKYIIALNKQMVDNNEPLTPGCTVALLPPYSGG